MHKRPPSRSDTRPIRPSTRTETPRRRSATGCYAADSTCWNPIEIESATSVPRGGNSFGLARDIVKRVGQSQPIEIVRQLRVNEETHLHDALLVARGRLRREGTTFTPV